MPMYKQNHAHAEEHQDYQRHKQTHQKTGKVDPYVLHTGTAAIHKDLNGLVGHCSAQPQEQRPAYMLDKMPGIHPQAEHEPEAHHHKFGKMGHLADHMQAEGAKAHGAGHLVDHLLYLLAAQAGLLCNLQRVLKNEHHAVNQTGSEENSKKNRERARSFFLIQKSIPPK